MVVTSSSVLKSLEQFPFTIMSHVEYTPVFASTNQPSFFPKAFKRINWLAGVSPEYFYESAGFYFVEDAFRR